MTDSTHLKLPYILPGQAQKHITHNEALAALDTLTQLAVLDRDLNTPPGSPDVNMRYIVGPTPTGAWSGKAGQVTAWEPTLGLDGQTPMLGINTTPDPTNRLAVASDAVLFTYGSDDVQLKLNKASTADTASLIFQTSFSGRAELGTTGDDNLHLKVSPDGVSWTEALVVDSGTVQSNFGGPVGLKSHPVSALPPATTPGALIFVSDAAGGSVVAFADGADWRRVTDRAVVS